MQERRQHPPEDAKQTQPSALRELLGRIARPALALIMLLAVIGSAITITQPIFARNAPVVGDVINQIAPTPEPAPVLTGPLTEGPLADSVARIEASPEFAEQKRRFAADLVRTGRMSPERADTVAHHAVREAFLRGVPPAVIFGVMLTENAQFISRARSNVGAVGLMQVYPKYWFKSLSEKFGDPNIEADSTNLRYGVFILEHYLRPSGRRATGEHVVTTQPGSLMKGLLRYNGCVRGTNTPRCHTYPNKVQRYVEQDAQALCGDRTFYQCIAEPFMGGLLGRRVASGD